MIINLKKINFKGFTVIEFLIASMLIVGVVGATSLAIQDSEHIQERYVYLNHATNAANSIFKINRAFNCLNPLPSDPSTNINTCTLLGINPFPSKLNPITCANICGEFLWSDPTIRTSLNSTTSRGFLVTFHTSYRQSFDSSYSGSYQNNDGCPLPNSANYPKNLSDANLPNIAVITLNLQYYINGVTKTLTYKDEEVLPISTNGNQGNYYSITGVGIKGDIYGLNYTDSSLGNVVIYGMASNSSGCLWFPYIPKNVSSESLFNITTGNSTVLTARMGSDNSPVGVSISV